MSTTLKVTQKSYPDFAGYNQVWIIDPDGTSVEAVSKSGRKYNEGHAAQAVAQREFAASQGDEERAEQVSRELAAQAGQDDKPIKVKELRKAVAAAKEHAAEAELEATAASAKLSKRRYEYTETLRKHTPALEQEAKSQLESSLLSLASGSAILRQGAAAAVGALEVLGGLAALRTEGQFRPLQLRAQDVGDMETAGAMEPHVQIAITEVSTAIFLASQILEQVKRGAIIPDAATDDEEIDPDEVAYTPDADDPDDEPEELLEGEVAYGVDDDDPDDDGSLR